MPTISVIVPAYNAEPTLEPCLRSAMAQTLADIEIVVVDDGSTDGTRSLIQRLAAQDGRIKPIALERNGGVCRARNCALDAAVGAWIALLDADDTMRTERLERLLAAAEGLGADWIADDQYFRRVEEERPVARLFTGEPDGARLIDPAHLVLRDCPEHLNYGLLKPLVRRAFLKAHHIRYRLGMERHEDFLFNIECAVHGAKFALLNEPLYNYFLRPGSLSATAPLNTMRHLKEVSQMIRDTLLASDQERLLDAFDCRDRLIERSLRYYEVVGPLKDGTVGAALSALGRDPLILPYLVLRAGRRAYHRVRGRDPLELVLLSGRVLNAPV
jgi:glycosyltransferase involved in cell wall biosynthesis